jgi:hypothetical protein
LKAHADASLVVRHGLLVAALGIAAAGSEYTYIATIIGL